MLRPATVLLALAVPALWHAEATVAGRCDRADVERLPVRFWESGGGGCHAALAIVAARVEVIGVLAHVTANHTYANDLSNPIDGATLTVTVPAGAVLLAFAVEGPGDGKEVRGEVQLKTQSSTPQVCTRPSPMLGLYETSAPPGAPRVQLRRMKPGDTVTVRLEYVLELRAKVRVAGGGGGAVLQLSLPVPVGARRRSPTVASPSADSAAVKVEIIADENTQVTSPTSGVTLEAKGDPAASTAKGTKATTKLRSTSVQDVALELAPGPVGPLVQAAEGLAPQPELLLQRHPQSGLLAAALMLPVAVSPLSPEAHELVLVLDRSASLRGVRLGRVQNAAQTFVRSVPRGARVNLVGFAADGAPLFGTSRELDEEGFTAAVSHLKAATPNPSHGYSSARVSAQADAAGRAQQVLSTVIKDLKRAEGTQLRVLLITDRHPLDSEDAIRFVKEHCVTDCRVSVLGIGWGASPPFVEGVAKAGGGTASFVAERGGTTALERALILQLAEALQPDVRSVDPDWSSLVEGSLPASEAAHVRWVAEESGPAAGGSKARAADESQRFAAQGGVREILAVPVEPLNAGGRLLALAFLGTETTPMSGSAPLRVQATVAGKVTAFNVRVPGILHEGASLHALCAARLSEALERADGKGEGSGEGGTTQHEWQQQALGLAYSIATAQTEWVTPPANEGNTPTEGGEPAAQCSVDAGGDHVGTAARPGDGGHSTWPAHSASRSPREADQLSLRRPPAAPGAEGADLPSSSTNAGGAGSTGGTDAARPKSQLLQLSTLDFNDLGSALSLRRVTTNSKLERFQHDLSGYARQSKGPFAGQLGARGAGETLALRNFLPLASGAGMRSILDFVEVGASLSLIGFGTSSRPTKPLSELPDEGLRPWWQDPYWHDDEELPDLGLPLNDDVFKVTSTSGAMLGTRDRGRMSGTLSVAGPAPTAKEPKGSKHTKSLEARLSAMDFNELGASLAINTPLQSNSLTARTPGRRAGVLSMLDTLFLGSSLAMGGYRRSMAVFGANRFRDPEDAEGSFGFGIDHGYARRDFRDGGGRAGDGQSGGKPALSLRSLSRMGAALSLPDPALAEERVAAVTNKLSVLDFDSMGASLALRPSTPPVAARGGAVQGGFGELASSLSLRRVSTSTWSAAARRVGGYPGGSLEDLPDFYSAEVESLFPGSRPSSAGSRGDDAEGRKPPVWVAIGVAGSLLAPVMSVSKTSSGCQPHLEQVRITWPAPSTSRTPAAVFLTAAGPLAPSVGGQGQQLGELAPPAAEPELRVSFHVSHRCDLSVRQSSAPGPQTKAGSKGSARVEDSAPTLLEVKLPEEPAATVKGQGPEVSALATALSARLQATRAGTVQAPAEPRDVVLTTASSTGAAAVPDAEPVRYLQLVAAQRFDGSFAFSAEGSATAAVDTETAEQAGLPAPLLTALAAVWGEKGPGTSGRVAAQTAAALAALRSQHASLSGGWALLAAKAEAWLATEGAVAAGCGNVTECVEAADIAVARWVTAPPSSARGIRW